MKIDLVYIRIYLGKYYIIEGNICYFFKRVIDVLRNVREKRLIFKLMIINIKNICKVFFIVYNYLDMIYCIMFK